MSNDKLRHVALKAAFQVIKPLIKVLLRHGVAHIEFAELARRAYVAAVEEDFAIEGRKLTTSRIAVLSGLSRKEVQRIRSLSEPVVVEEKGPLNRAARVISGWVTDDEFKDSTGKPAELAEYGERKSFAALVKRYSGDITAGAILDELIRVGAVICDNGKVVLCTTAYLPKKGQAEQLQIYATCAGDLLNTLGHNVQENVSDSLFQREVVYQELTDENYRAFKLLSEKKSEKLLKELNDWLNEKKSSQKEPGRIRTGLGIYFISDK